MMIAFMFPGQGSQQRGMGADLFDSIWQYRALEKNVDALLGYSARKLCLEDRDNLLKQTQYTQPCLYIVNALYYYNAINSGERCQAVAGHSLGEYNALLAADAFDFLTGLRLVKRRGELMAQSGNGGMAAVIGLPPADVARVLSDHGLTSIDIANYNSPTQTIISGPAADIEHRAASLFESAGASLYLPLQVSGAFHSRYMAVAARSFAAFIDGLSFHTLRLPVIANVTAQPYPREQPASTYKSLLVQQMTQPVRWLQTVQYLRGMGATAFKEIGPGNVLTKIVQQS
jgi:malonyl CoA-acyl carrier protein transacylase